MRHLNTKRFGIMCLETNCPQIFIFDSRAPLPLIHTFSPAFYTEIYVSRHVSKFTLYCYGLKANFQLSSRLYYVGLADPFVGVCEGKETERERESAKGEKLSKTRAPKEIFTQDFPSGNSRGRILFRFSFLEKSKERTIFQNFLI